MSYINNWRGRMMGILRGRGREKNENMQMFVYSHEWISNECSITKSRDEDMLKRMPVNVTLSTIATSDILEFHCLEATQHINSITPPGEEWEEKLTQIHSYFFLTLGEFWSIRSRFLFEKSGNLEELRVSYLRGQT